MEKAIIVLLRLSALHNAVDGLKESLMNLRGVILFLETSSEPNGGIPASQTASRDWSRNKKQ
jgi:hypothetical protein